MTLNSARVRSYEDAQRFLGIKAERPAGNNTRIIRRDDNVIIVKYHESAVVEYFPREMVDNGPVTVLRSDGWRTSTTKERINSFCPEGFYVYQERGNWYLAQRDLIKHWDEQTRWIFADGITIDREGNVYNAGDDTAEEQTKQITKRIKAYVEGYIKALLAGDVPAPSAGDCWYCGMVTTDHQNLGDAMRNVDHIESHFDEKYYVPSLLYNAIEYKPVCMLARGTLGYLWGLTGESPRDVYDFERDILSRDCKRSLTAYLKHEFGIAA